MDFLLVLKNFFARRYGYWLKIGISTPADQFGPKRQVEGVTPYQPFFLSENWDEWSLSCGISIWAQVSFVLSPFTRLTDRWTSGSWLISDCIAAAHKNTCTSKISPKGLYKLLKWLHINGQNHGVHHRTVLTIYFLQSNHHCSHVIYWGKRFQPRASLQQLHSTTVILVKQ